MRRVWDEAFTLYGLIAEFVEMPEDRSSITFYINPKANDFMMVLLLLEKMFV